jgi:hypothetical protein
MTTCFVTNAIDIICLSNPEGTPWSPCGNRFLGEWPRAYAKRLKLAQACLGFDGRRLIAGDFAFDRLRETWRWAPCRIALPDARNRGSRFGLRHR